MRIAEFFQSIQGEGEFAGTPSRRNMAGPGVSTVVSNFPVTSDGTDGTVSAAGETAFSANNEVARRRSNSRMGTVEGRSRNERR